MGPARRLGLDGVRDRPAAEVGRRRGRRRGDRPARRAAGRPGRAAHVRRVRDPAAAAPQRAPRARRAAARGRPGRRAGRVPTAGTTRSPARCAGSARVIRGRGLVVVVSDFREGAGQRPEWARALRSLAGHHDVLAVEIVDAREGELPDAGQLVLVDPETGARMEADTASPALRRDFAAAELARRDALRSAPAPGGRAPRRAVAPATTGCASSDGSCDELPGPRLPPRPRWPFRSRWPRWPSPGAAPRATPSASRRSRRWPPSRRAARAGDACCRPACSAPRSRRSHSPSRARRRPWPCRSSARRSCSSPTRQAR